MFAQESRAALAAVSFLTRVPIPVRLGGDDVRRAGTYFPLAGAGVGALSGAAARRWGAPIGLAAETLLTGALHLDALADSADALGTADRERALEIMRDSRIGSFGAVAICLDLMVRARAIEGLESPIRVMAGAGALSRATAVVLSTILPYPRDRGTAAALSSGSGLRAALACGLAVAISRDSGAILVAAASAVASAGFWQRKLGGITGDGLGASIELTETAILLWSVR